MDNKLIKAIQIVLYDNKQKKIKIYAPQKIQNQSVGGHKSIVSPLSMTSLTNLCLLYNAIHTH